MCNLFKSKGATKFNLSVKTYSHVITMMTAAGINASLVPPRDDYFWYPSYNHWIEVIKGAHNSAPPYQAITDKQPGYDCDKFARHLSDYAAVNYLINGCFEVWGYETFSTPAGYHAWNIILADDGLFEVEPQTADIWEAGSNSQYKTKTIYFVSCPVIKERLGEDH